MSGPAPMDMNRLKGMLSGAKAVMQKVDSGNFETGNVNLDTTVKGDQLLEAHQVQGGGMPQQNTQSVAPQMQGGQPVYNNINNSKLPPEVLKAMVEQPIPQMSGPNHTFNLSDVQDLVEKPMPMQTQVRTNRAPQQQPVTESVQRNANDTFTVSESALRGIIKDIVRDELLGFMNETYSKTLTEQAIKKTINTLIKEGKIKTKKSVNS